MLGAALQQRSDEEKRIMVRIDGDSDFPYTVAMHYGTRFRNRTKASEILISKRVKPILSIYTGGCHKGPAVSSIQYNEAQRN